MLALPQVRCQLFGSCRTLLETAGVGAVRPLAPSLLAAAAAELYGRKQAAQQEGDGAEGPARKKARKGKQAAAAADFAGEAAAGADRGPVFGTRVASGVHCPAAPRLRLCAACGMPDSSHLPETQPGCLPVPRAPTQRPLCIPQQSPFAPSLLAAAPLDDLGAAAQLRDQAVQAAALQALEALCTAGAPLLAPQQRRQLDDTAAHVAATAAAAACQLSSDTEAAVGASLAALQLAAHRLLLATLLAPAPHRPPHLAAALRLWRTGSAGGSGGTLPAFCRHVSTG